MTNWRDQRRGAQALVREGDKAQSIAAERAHAERLGDDPDKIRCIVTHEDAGGWCERPAVMEVYGLFFCGVHGQEAKAGALEELYQDASDFLNRMDNPAIPDAATNPEALAVIRAGAEELTRLCIEAGDGTDELLRRAYPVIADRVDPETAEFDYGTDPGSHDPPYDTYRAEWHRLHGLMRLAFEAGDDWLVEILEPERESVAAQAAFGLAVLEEHEARRTNSGIS